MSPRLVATLTLALHASCALTEESWPDDYAAAWCGRSKQCDGDAFAAEWTNRAECKQTMALWTWDGIQGLEESFPGCDFDLEEGRDCLRAVESATCADFLDGEFGIECGTHLVICDD